MANLTVKSCFLAIILIFILFAFCSFYLALGVANTRPLQVIACDVGQGDATLVLYGQLVILIDTGPDSSVMQCLQAKIHPLRPRIDILVLTHDDSDHIGGFSEVSRKYEIGMLFINPKIKGTQSAAAVREWMELHRKFHYPLVGESLSFAGLRLHFIWSEDSKNKNHLKASVEEGSNENSIALYLETQGFGFLAAGDLGCAQELALTSSSLLKKVHLLKMSHHGSKTSSCLEYMDRIRPEAAYYSAGKGNSYGHPSQISLDNTHKFAYFLKGTDQNGSLFFQWIDGRLGYQSHF